MLSKTNILLLLLISFLGTICAKGIDLKPIQNLSITNGLVHNGVTAIHEDSKGYIWIGTYDGLNRYDGFSFKTFKNAPTNKIFVSSRIRTISEDKKSNLWLGTDEGISIYNPTNKHFKTILSNKNMKDQTIGPIIRKIIVSKEGTQIICLSEENGLFIFDQQYQLQQHLFPSEEICSPSTLYFDGLELDSLNYLFATSSGLISFNPKSQQFKRILKGKIKNSTTLRRINQDCILAAMDRGLGIITIDHSNETDHYTLNQKILEDARINSISTDNLNHLWVGTIDQGIIHIDNVRAFIKGQPYTRSNLKSIQGILRISSIFTSASTGCWIGTFNKGVFRFNLRPNPFKSDYSASPSESNSDRVAQFTVLDSTRVFIDLSRNHINLFDYQKQRFIPLPIVFPPRITIPFLDSRGDYWAYFYNGWHLQRVQPTGSLQSKYSQGIKMSPPRKITEDRFGNIWVITPYDLYKISRDHNNEITQVESFMDIIDLKKTQNSLFRSLYCDSKYDYIWAGTDEFGLFRIDITDNMPLGKAKINRYTHNDEDLHSISSNFVSSIVRLPNGELWIGTERGGICKVLHSNKEPRFLAFTEQQGLSNNVVKSIEYDQEYNLWIATNIGLNKFDTKSFEFKSFKTKDGLPFEDFYYPSAKLADGTMFFSGLNGFCYFNPQEVSTHEQIPRLEFEEFKIFNHLVFPGDTLNKRVILQTDLSNTKVIQLKYNENVFSLKLTSLHFSTPENHHLRYQLLPINNEWIEVQSNQQTVSYDGLPPGEYTFRAMASNSLNEWSQPKSLRIIIKPPFWSTTPAFLLYIGLLGFIIYFIIAYYLRINKLKHNLEIEHIEKKKVQEINTAKLRFFSNISHEIKTPLTLISGPINLISEKYKGNSDLANHLQFVQRQIKKIMQLVDQVHDFQRADANKLRLNPERFCFDDFIEDVVNDFRFWANNDAKTLKVQPDTRKIYVSADKDKLEKIINNLLTNAFKFTKVNDTIIFRYYKEKSVLNIIVEDTGKGILPTDLPHIFEQFYRSKASLTKPIKGSGIGLAFAKHLVELHRGTISAMSSENRGTTMTIKLPVAIELTQEGLNKAQETPQSAKEEQQKVPQVGLIDQMDPSQIEVTGSFSEALIFIAEDNSDLRQYLDGILSHFFKVKTFENGQELSKALLTEWPDIVVSDVLMPELNGYDLCKQIKTDLKTSHIPVVLLTACSSTDAQIKGLKDGADAYIEKPFDIQHLITSIEGLLQSRKQLRERFQIDLPLKINKKENSDQDFLFLEDLYRLMEENLGNANLDTNQMAKQLYLNRTLFFHKVKTLTNQTPFELLKTYRLKRAAEFLAQKQHSVNEVYIMTGFKSRPNFYKLFKERYHYTPGEFAKKAIKNYSKDHQEEKD